MSKFTDQVGKEWTLAVTPYEYAKIKKELGIDIYDVVDKEKAKDVYQAIESDDMVLSELLWLICEDDAAGCGVDKRSFLKALPGEILGIAYLALLEAMRDFFRRPEHRMIMDKMIAFVRAVQAKVLTEAAKGMSQVDVESQAQRFIESAMNSAEFSASTPSQQTETAGGDTP